MRAALSEKHGEPLLVVDDVELAPPQQGEVIVDITHVGVCHSDLTVLDAPMFPTPLVAGHEAVGVVREAAAGARVEPGQRVVMTMRPPCHQCWWCHHGEVALCSRGPTAPGLHHDGTTRLSRRGQTVYRGVRLAAFAESVVVDASGVTPLPDDLPSSLAATMGCAVQTGVGAVNNIACVRPGESVLVIGLGGVGLSVVQGARISGASTIIAVDPVAERRNVATQVGATHVVDPQTDGDVVTIVRDLCGGRGADHAFDLVGNQATATQSVAAIRAGGGVVMIGGTPAPDGISLDLFGMTIAQKRLSGCYLGDSSPQRDFPKLFDLWRSGQLDLDALGTKQRPFDEINDAIDDLRHARGVRTVLTFG
jgi:S-(hydroxymethyl)glutathione dehydrogenase/alcohol dehydrogenase